MTNTRDGSGTGNPGLTRRALLALSAAGVSSFALAQIFGMPQPARAAPLWVGGWGSPLNTSSPGVNSPFLEGGYGHGYYDGVNYHLGLDLAADSNEPVYSIGSGTVLDVQTGDYPGQALFIKHTAPDGTEFQGVYGHINVGVSGAVAAGQQIGTVFAQTAHHLHFGIRTILSAYPRWGARNLDYWPTTDGFVEPMDFLTAHPQGTGAGIGTREQEMIVVKCNDGAGRYGPVGNWYYMVVSDSWRLQLTSNAVANDVVKTLGYTATSGTREASNLGYVEWEALLALPLLVAPSPLPALTPLGP